MNIQENQQSLSFAWERQFNTCQHFLLTLTYNANWATTNNSITTSEILTPQVI